MPSLVDTNVLVYRFDPRFPEKQQRATELLRDGIRDGSLRIPHQALVEFVAATTGRRDDAEPLLAPSDARREAEEMLAQFEVLYPNEALFRLALRGAATYELSWQLALAPLGEDEVDAVAQAVLPGLVKAWDSRELPWAVQAELGRLGARAGDLKVAEAHFTDAVQWYLNVQGGTDRGRGGAAGARPGGRRLPQP